MRPYDGIPTAEQEALLPPDWDPIDAAVAGMTVGGHLPARAAAAGMDVFAQGLSNQLPWYVSLPASMAAGQLAGKAMSRNLVPGGAPLQEAGVIGPAAGKYIDTWHASPHQIDRFDSNKIGTGEGSQYRGYGLYFAESPEVSGPAPIGDKHSFYDRLFQEQALQKIEYPNVPQSYYRGAPPPPPEGTPPAALLARKLGPDIVHTLRYGSEEEKLALRSSYPEVTAFWEANKPSIYQTRLHVDPDQLLDLDAPVSQELLNKFSPRIQKALDRVTTSYIPWTNALRKAPEPERSIMKAPEEYTGWDLYTTLMNNEIRRELPFRAGYGPSLQEKWSAWRQKNGKWGDPNPSYRGAAAYLNSVGIPGNKFFDGKSRAAGPLDSNKTRNYVMYPGNDDKIEILKRWGMLLPLAEAQRQEDATVP